MPLFNQITLSVHFTSSNIIGNNYHIITYKHKRYKVVIETIEPNKNKLLCAVSSSWPSFSIIPIYKSKLSSLSKKSKRPIVSMPSSLRRGMIWSLTTITFLKESFMFMSDRDSWISFSLSGMDKAD